MIIHTHETSTERHTVGLTRVLSVGQSGENDVPTDVEPGSDADIDRADQDDDKAEDSDTGSEATEPSPEGTDPDSIESDNGGQMDDNIDDLGRRPDGTTQDQPGIAKP